MAGDKEGDGNGNKEGDGKGDNTGDGYNNEGGGQAMATTILIGIGTAQRTPPLELQPEAAP